MLAWRAAASRPPTRGSWCNANAAVVDCRLNECNIAMLAGRGAELAVQDCQCEGGPYGIRAELWGYSVSAKRLTVARGLWAKAAPDTPAW